MNVLLTLEQLEALRRLDACTLANAIETFHERLRNEGFTDGARALPVSAPAADGRLRRHDQDPRLRAADGGRSLLPTAPIGGNMSFPCRAARGRGAGHRHASRAGLVAGRGACQHSAGVGLRGVGDERRRARHSQPPRRWGSSFLPAAFRFPTLTSTSWSSAPRSKSTA